MYAFFILKQVWSFCQSKKNSLFYDHKTKHTINKTIIIWETLKRIKLTLLIVTKQDSSIDAH